MSDEIQVVVVTPDIPFAEAVAVNDDTDCCKTYVEHPLQCCFLTSFVSVVLFVFVYEVFVLHKQ